MCHKTTDFRAVLQATSYSRTEIKPDSQVHPPRFFGPNEIFIVVHVYIRPQMASAPDKTHLMGS